MGHRIRLHYPDALGGSFEVHPHGDSSRNAEAFADFDCETPLATAQYVLNANGIAAFYVKVSVDVVVKNSTGATVDTFTDGVRAELVDMESQSFTGTDSSGSQVAGGVVDEAAVFDRWKDSAGTVDWKVRRTGSSVDETLIQAFASVTSTYSPFFNVKSYGALGDGTSDDYPAFLLAYNAAVAAGGGIIFVPASANPYLLGQTLTITSTRVSMMGCGPSASIITNGSGTVSSVAVAVACGVSTPVENFIRDIGFRNSAASTGVLSIASAPGFRLLGVGSNCANSNGVNGALYLTTPVVIHGCFFTNTSATTTRWINCDPGSGGTQILASRFAQTGNVAVHGFLELEDTDIVVDGCRFESVRTAAGVASHISIPAATGGARCRVTNCHFVVPAAPTSAHEAINLGLDVDFYESGNTMNQALDSTHKIFVSGGAGYLSRIYRGSRMVGVNGVPTAGSYTPNTSAWEHRIVAAGAFTVNAPTLASEFVGDGGFLTFIILNNTGGAINVTWAAGYNVTATPTNVAAGQYCRAFFIYDAATTTFRAIAAVGNF